MDTIARLRSRHQQLTANIAHYEDRVARNTAQLDFQRKTYDEEDEQGFDHVTTPAPSAPPRMTREHLQQEEQEIRDLESKKRGLEDRVTGMEKDLGGLMR